MTPSDEQMARILLQTRTIAMVGASIKPDRPSFRVGTYLDDVGYRVFPVNPGHSGKELFGETVAAHLSEIEEPVDMLNIFRRPDQVLPMVEAAISALPGLKFVWMQLGIRNDAARILARAHGLDVIEDKCLLIEHKRLILRELAV